MKKLLLSLLIFCLSLVYLSTSTTPVYAQGNCTCGYDGSGNCVVQTNNCDSDAGFTPACGALCSCACGGGTIPTLTPPPTTPPSGGGPIQTAIGPIDVNTPEAFVEAILNFAIGIGGGIAILLIIYGAFLYLTSAGNPEKVQAGKELINSAIVGLLVIIFAVFIMEMVGQKILKIFP